MHTTHVHSSHSMVSLSPSLHAYPPVQSSHSMVSFSLTLHAHNSCPQVTFYGKCIPHSTCTQLRSTSHILWQVYPPLYIHSTTVPTSHSMVSLAPPLHTYHPCPQLTLYGKFSPSLDPHNSCPQLTFYGKFVPLST